MDVYLSGTFTRPYVITECKYTWQEKTGRPVSFEKSIVGGGGTMNLYLAGEHPVKNGKFANGGGQLILESYFHCRDNKHVPRLLPHLGGFLLDSGAFTFLQGNKSVDWDKYTEEYAEWINRYNISLFFELDIDPIVGLREVERLRAKLERLTGKQSIPVWHKNRGKDYYIGMAKDYPYIALGGIAIKEIPREKFEKAFPWFIDKAHENGAKLHGLGYTSLEGLHKYHFDSVDSTAWLYGNRGGYLYIFNAKKGTMDKIDAPKGTRLKSQDAARHNFTEWLKFQEYAKRYL